MIGLPLSKIYRSMSRFFNGHFPEEPVMPGVLMIEALAQSAGVLQFISKNKKPQDGILFLLRG